VGAGVALGAGRAGGLGPTVGLAVAGRGVGVAEGAAARVGVAVGGAARTTAAPGKAAANKHRPAARAWRRIRLATTLL
jgi:hypothetical protein